MTKLNDTQLILLSTASQRDNGSLMPLPDTLAGADDRIDKAIAGLIKKALVEEGPVNELQFSWRERDASFIGVRITDAGRATIGVDGADAGVRSPTPAPVPQQRSFKTELVLGLLQREGGATLEEMVKETGWLPHSTRAALTGLRKKGYDIQKGKRGDVTCYHITANAA